MASANLAGLRFRKPLLYPVKLWGLSSEIYASTRLIARHICTENIQKHQITIIVIFSIWGKRGEKRGA